MSPFYVVSFAFVVCRLVFMFISFFFVWGNICLPAYGFWFYVCFILSVLVFICFRVLCFLITICLTCGLCCFCLQLFFSILYNAFALFIISVLIFMSDFVLPVCFLFETVFLFIPMCSLICHEFFVVHSLADSHVLVFSCQFARYRWKKEDRSIKKKGLSFYSAILFFCLVIFSQCFPNALEKKESDPVFF